MAYKVIILYQLYMPSYFLGTFTEYPYFRLQADRLAKTTNSVFYAAGSFCDRKGGG